MLTRDFSNDRPHLEKDEHAYPAQMENVKIDEWVFLGVLGTLSKAGGSQLQKPWL